MLEFLTKSEANGAALAIVLASGETVTRGDLAGVIAEIRAFCQRAQITSAHRIGILLENCWQYPTLTLALSEICSVLPINPALTDFEITALAKDAGLSALLGLESDARVDQLSSALGLGRITARMPANTIELALKSPLSPPKQDRPSGMVLLTSGTTGLPKRVPIRTDAMLASAKTIASTLQLGASDRAVHALPMFHIGAVVDLFLAPLLAGGAVIISKGQAPADLDHAVSQHGGTWVQLVPTMLARCVDDLSPDQRAHWGSALRFIRSVSSDLSPEQHASSEAAFDALPIIQMYGMSETAGQICSNPLPPQERRFGTVGAASGPNVRLLDNVGAPVPQGQEGEICVSGPTVMRGYEGVDAQEHFWSDWLRTGDLGRLDEAGYLTLTGRVKEMINRGGEKVSPLEIERCALALNGVLEAAAYAQKHLTLGEQVGLSLVLQKDAALSEPEVLAHLASQLAEHKRPRKIDFRSAMPRLGSGKVDRLALAGARKDASASDQDLSALGQQVSRIWQDILGSAAPQSDDDFFDAGGDSLQATTFLSEVEKVTGAEVDPNLLYEAPRFGAMLDALQTKLPEPPPQSAPDFLRYLRKHIGGWQGARVGARNVIIGQRMMGALDPVFILSQGEHTAILPHLNPERPAFLMRSLFGLKGKDETINRALAQIYAEDILSIRPKGPLFLVGYCEGAKLAHFIAQILRERGRETDLIVSIDHTWGDPWDGAALHVQSEDWAIYKNPELGLRHLTTGGAALVRLEGRHLDALQGPSMPDLATRMERLFSGQETLPRTVSPCDFAARNQMYHAQIRAKLPRTFKPGSSIAAQIEVVNNSSVDWQPSAQSGISLTIDLHNLDGHCRQRVAGHGTFTAPIRAHQSALVDVTIAFPNKFMPLQARISMTDEGLCRFLTPSKPYVSRMLWPFGRT